MPRFILWLADNEPLGEVVRAVERRECVKTGSFVFFIVEIGLGVYLFVLFKFQDFISLIIFIFSYNYTLKCVPK